MLFLTNIAVFLLIYLGNIQVTTAQDNRSQTLDLPKPQLKGNISLEETLRQRQSIRDYTETSLSLRYISQLLWAAQGSTDSGKRRTAPSAGALYPLELYLVVGNVDSLSKGIYKYQQKSHKLVQLDREDRRRELYKATLEQPWIKNASAVIVITGIYERTTSKYGERGIRYVHIEVGHVAQNIYLQAASLGLGTVIVGAFDDNDVQTILRLSSEERVFALMPIGRKKGSP